VAFRKHARGNNRCCCRVFLGDNRDRYVPLVPTLKTGRIQWTGLVQIDFSNLLQLIWLSCLAALLALTPAGGSASSLGAPTLSGLKPGGMGAGQGMEDAADESGAGLPRANVVPSTPSGDGITPLEVSVVRFMACVAIQGLLVPALACWPVGVCECASAHSLRMRVLTRRENHSAAGPLHQF